MLTDPAIWWYVTRSSGMVAWVLLVAGVFWGILLSTRIMRPIDSPAWLLDLHRWLGGLAVTFTALHMVSLYLDNYAHFSVADLLLPGHSTYEKIATFGPIPVALGVIAFYLVTAVQLTSLMMRRLPRRVWKFIHLLSFIAVAVVSFHAGWLGSDLKSMAYRVVALSMIFFTALAGAIRVLFPKSARTLAARVEGRRPAKLDGTQRVVKVASLRKIANRILEITLVDPDGSALPIWAPGAHLTLHLPNEMKRQYSLCGDPANRTEYQISVLLAPDSRGGSAWLHEHLIVGADLQISGPHNHFELEPANGYRFIAGGIGITPIKSMIESLPDRRDWRLLYLGSNRESMAFAQELSGKYGNRVELHPRAEVGQRANLATFLADDKAQVYVCGPEPLLQELQTLVPPDRLHYERFKAAPRTGEDVAFTVQLGHDGPKAEVGLADNTLDVINQIGGQLISSCGEGVCGSCEVRVLSGSPAHRDSVMSDADKDEIGVMYPCVSRAQGGTLVLDL